MAVCTALRTSAGGAAREALRTARVSYEFRALRPDIDPAAYGVDGDLIWLHDLFTV